MVKQPHRRWTLAQWQKAFPLCQQQPELGSWVFKRKDGHISCKACFLEGCKIIVGANAQAQRVRKDHLQKHQKTLAHKQNVAKLTQCKHCEGIASAKETCLAAPSAKAFCEVIFARRSGGSLGAIRTIGRRQKLNKLQFCVAEAMRAMDREHIRKSDSLGFHCDGRKNGLPSNSLLGFAKTCMSGEVFWVMST